MSNIKPCPDCKAKLPEYEGSVHEYLGGNAACWKLYGEVLAKEYGDVQYFKFHRWTVDAYAVQHPGKPEPRSIQSVQLHLLALFLRIEKRVEPSFIIKVMQNLTETKKGKLLWLTPPTNLGTITIAQVAEAGSPKQHGERVAAWGRCVWDAWREHHTTIATLAKEFL